MKERNEFAEKDGSFEHTTLSKDGIFGKTARYDRDFLVSTENKKYKVTHINDLCYNPANLKFGVICLNKYGDAIFSPIYVTFEIQSDYDADFVGENLSRWDFINKALRYQQGTVYERMAVSPEDFLSIKCYMPSKREQEKLSRFIGLLDEKIVSQQKYIDNLKKYKRGLHKLVFIKKRKPSWEKLALHDIASFCGGGTPSKDVSSYWEGEIGWISSSDIQEEWIDDISVTRRITKTAIDNSATKLCPEGTIAIVSRVGVGKVAIMPESLCTSQDFTNITSITGNTHYMAYQIAFRMKLEAMKTQGTSIKGVTGDTIKAMVLDIPPLEEQKKIADMLTAFDSYIKRAVCELDLFLAMKKALLQQLFI